MAKKAVFGAVLLVIFLAVAGLVAWRGSILWRKSQEQKKERTEAIAVAIATVKYRDLRDQRLFTGTLAPNIAYNIAARVSGRLLELQVKRGTRLVIGQLIARIDDEEYQQSVEQALAEYRITEALLQEAREVLKLRTSDYGRQRKLGSATSAAAVESCETNMKSQAAVVQKYEAELKKKDALLRQEQIKLEDTRIFSRSGGSEKRPGVYFIGETYVDAGALLTVNQAIARVIEISSLTAQINVIERDYPLVHIGQKGEITTDAYPGEVFEGEVQYVSQELQSESRQAAIDLRISNTDLRLKPGMFVRVKLEFARHLNAQLVPRMAVLRQNGVDGVFGYNQADGCAHFIPVSCGIVSGEDIEILTPQIKLPIITLGNHLLADGTPVAPSETVTVGEKQSEQD